jgi:hypothetical protein
MLMNRRSRLARSVVIATAAVVMSVLGLAAPAAAADATEVSLDGVSYSTAGSGTVFTAVAAMVPGDRQDATFFIRNTSERPAFVRIVLSDVRYTDLDYANALSFSAAADGIAGVPIPATLADPCWLLTEGQVISPGGRLVVTASAMLGNLDGTVGQDSTVTADFGVSLSDQTPGSLSPDDCGSIDVGIPAVPVTGGGDRPVGVGAQGGAASGGLVPNPLGDLPVLSQPGMLGMDPNTWHLWEEYLILIPIGAALVGILTHRAIVWRRRNATDQQETVA